MRRPDLSLGEGAWLAATVFCVAFISALGILLAVLGGMHAHYESRRGLLVAYGVLALVGAARELAALA